MLQVDNRINYAMNIEGCCNKYTWWHLPLKYLLVSIEVKGIDILLQIIVGKEEAAYQCL
jgi:hypothetical protein